ncbi:MAG TPA: SWIM zinc finger family protein [Isosphaeraceae bacterium]|jgi:hypothetical protein
MLFDFAYGGDSTVRNDARGTAMSFAPDIHREPTFFRGKLRKGLAFREAISALHDVVVSDLRWKPKDRAEYKAWREAQEEADLAVIAAKSEKTVARIREVRAELDRLHDVSHQRMKPYLDARREYFQYLLKRDFQAWIVLDPVITVHPDCVFFECFSKDESSYGRLSVGYDVFQDVGEFSCGTTNIDYSDSLYDEFQKIRSYKETSFEIDPSGFGVVTGRDEAHKEVKIDLPDSWVRGFLQVSSAMSLPALRFRLHPLDVHNICLVLRRHRELVGPRALRYHLKPGEPVRVLLEPWGIEVPCPRSVYEGEVEDEVRVWGRRRLHTLERLIPVARGFEVHLLGKGMPSFYVADLGDMSYTLGLSGWTRNDWAGAGNFDLLAPRAEVDDATRTRVFDALRETWYETPDSLADRLGLDRSTVLGALSAYTQAGRAIWDLEKGCYRLRELTRDPLPMDALRFQNDREERAARFLDEGRTRITQTTDDGTAITIRGEVRHGETPKQPWLRLDADERVVEAECTCNFFQQNRLRRGPCEHILALRLLHARRRRASALLAGV